MTNQTDASETREAGIGPRARGEQLAQSGVSLPRPDPTWEREREDRLRTDALLAAVRRNEDTGAQTDAVVADAKAFFEFLKGGQA